jgi:hypothetical protein
VARLDAEPLFLSAEAASDLGQASDVFTVCYMRLAAWANARGETQFKLRPKTHDLVHVFERVKFRKTRLNPRFNQCFLDEDFVGRVSFLSRKPHQAQLGLRVLQRYLMLLESI